MFVVLYSNKLSCFIMPLYKIYTMYSILKRRQCGIGFIVDAFFGNFAYLCSLYTVVELHTNFVLIYTFWKAAYIIHKS